MSDNEQFVFTSDSPTKPSEPTLMEFSAGINTGVETIETHNLGQEIDPFESNSVFQENTDPEHEANEGGEELLAQLTSENIKSEMMVTERYGAEVWSKIKDVAASTVQKLEASGEKALDWAEKRGIPLPHSKIGNAIAAGTLGIAGFAPGAGILWGISYIFLKRAREAGAEESSLSDTLQTKSVRTA